MPDRFEGVGPLGYLLLGGGFAGITGTLHYLIRVKNGVPFHLTELILHAATSFVTGLIAFEVLSAYGLSNDLCGALSGVAGWSGAKIAVMLEITLVKRLGITKEDVQTMQTLGECPQDEGEAEHHESNKNQGNHRPRPRGE